MLHVKPFEQRVNYCGPASLKMVLDYYGIKKSEQELARLSHAKKGSGVSASNLIAAAQKLGLKAYFKDFQDFKDIRHYVLKKKIPVLVQWFSEDDGHYSVVVDINRENIYLQDPDLGHLRAFKLSTFKRIWFDFPPAYLRSKKDIIIRRMIVIHP